MLSVVVEWQRHGQCVPQWQQRTAVADGEVALLRQGQVLTHLADGWLGR